MNKEERQEYVAKNRRKFWALELLWEELWRKEKVWRDLRRWSKQILLEQTGKVILAREIISSALEESIKQVDEKDKQRVRRESRKMEVIDKEREERRCRARRKSDNARKERERMDWELVKKDEI